MIPRLTCTRVEYAADRHVSYIRDKRDLSSLLQEILVKNLRVHRSCNQRIAVHFFSEAINRFCSGVDKHKYLKVTFARKPAVDNGGPLREFLHNYFHDRIIRM